MDTGQDCAGPSGNFGRLWPSWWHLLATSCGHVAEGGLQPESFPSLSFAAEGTKLWIIGTLNANEHKSVEGSSVTWGGVCVQCVLCHQHRQPVLFPSPSMPISWSSSSRHYWSALLWHPVPSAALSDCSCISARAEDQAPAFCHFSLKRNKVFMPVMCIISQISLKCSPSYLGAVPCCLSKKKSSREGAFQNTVGNNLGL